MSDLTAEKINEIIAKSFARIQELQTSEVSLRERIEDLEGSLEKEREARERRDQEILKEFIRRYEMLTDSYATLAKSSNEMQTEYAKVKERNALLERTLHSIVQAAISADSVAK